MALYIAGNLPFALFAQQTKRNLCLLRLPPASHNLIEPKTALPGLSAPTPFVDASERRETKSTRAIRVDGVLEPTSKREAVEQDRP